MFVAVQPPGHVLDDLAAFLEPRSSAGLTWIDPAQWHLTLAFFASVPEHRVEDLADRLGDATRDTPPFGLTLTGAGAFPDPIRARVLWLGVQTHATTDAPEPLARLAARSRHSGNGVGAPPDGRRFVAHLSLARLRRPIEATRWLRVLDTYVSPTWTVDRLALVASYLGEGQRGRPRHETVAEVALGGSSAGPPAQSRSR